MKSESMNSAGVLANYFVDSKLTPLFVLLCVAIGAFALIKTQKEETPQIAIPMVQVVAHVPGASAAEIENWVVKPLEVALGAIPKIKDTMASIQPNMGVLVVEFEVGSDKASALTLVHNQVNTLASEFAALSTQISVAALDVDDIPFLTLALTSEVYDARQLRQMAEEIKYHLRSVKQISVMDVIGGVRPEIKVRVNPEALVLYGVSITEIERALNSSNLSLHLGARYSNNQKISYFVDGTITDIDALKALIVKRVEGVPIYLEQVANINWATAHDAKEHSYFVSKGPQNSHKSLAAVSMTFAKQQGANAVEVADSLLNKLEELKTTQIPDEIDITVTRNDGKRANDAVNDLISNLVMAMITVVLVSAFFLGWIEGLIIGIAVPLILALVLGADLVFGVSINRIALFALILAMGMLVDAATVVIDNITRQKNKSVSVIVGATNEIGGATNLATLAIILVFLSTGVVTGVLGEYFFPLTFNVPVAMFASLVVAYIFVPWAAKRFSRENTEIKESVFEKYVIAKFRVQLRHLLKVSMARKKLLGVVLLLIILSLMQISWQFVRPQGPGGPVSFGAVAVSMLPIDDASSFVISVTAPDNSPVENTAIVVSEIETLIQEVAEIDHYQVFLGSSGPANFTTLTKGVAGRIGENFAELQVNLFDKDERERTSADIVQWLDQRINVISARNPKFKLNIIEQPPGPPQRSTLLAEVYGDNPIQMGAISEKLQTIMKDTYGTKEVYDNRQTQVKEIRLMVDREKAQFYGVSVVSIYEFLAGITQSRLIGLLHHSKETEKVAIRIEADESFQFSETLLSLMTIKNVRGEEIPLLELVRLNEGIKEQTIERKNGERVVYVGAELMDSAPFYAVLDLDQKVKAWIDDSHVNLTTHNLGLNSVKPDTSDGSQIHWQGEVRMSLDMFRDLFGALLIALFAIFVLLIAYYQSFSIPMIAMSAIPLSIIGVFPGHWFMGADFSGPSLIGIIALAGIVLRNALLIIDFTMIQMEKGLTLEEALVEATTLRLTAISLTALTIVIGSYFMLSDPVFGGLAISLIFGTLSATLLTPFIIPLALFRHFRKLGLGFSSAMANGVVEQ